MIDEKKVCRWLCPNNPITLTQLWKIILSLRNGNFLILLGRQKRSHEFVIKIYLKDSRNKGDGRDTRKSFQQKHEKLENPFFRGIL